MILVKPSFGRGRDLKIVSIIPHCFRMSKIA